jgi:GNAT superfamily N-acetyltransferase
MDKIQVRKAKIDDLESVLLLSDELTLSDFPYDKEVDIQWAHTENGKEYYLDKINNKKGICFMAECNGTIAGYATAAVKEVPSYRLVKVAELENLVVDNRMRNKGIGKALLNYFIKWAKEIGADRASVNVFSSNKKGIAFYEREGFTSYDTTLELLLKSNAK